MHAAVHLICIDIASSLVHLRSASSQDRYCNTSPINIHCPVAVATRSLTAETYSIYTKLGNLPQTMPGNWLVRSLGICAITGKKSCTDTQKGLQNPLGPVWSLQSLLVFASGSVPLLHHLELNAAYCAAKSQVK